MAKHEECVVILEGLQYEDADPILNFEMEPTSYARALDTSTYEDCLQEHRDLLTEYQQCVRDQIPDFDAIPPWSVGDRECVGGGGQCGPPANGQDPLPDYGWGPNAPNYTALGLE
jgi:hypothetical protein